MVTRSVADLRKGEKGTICSFKDAQMSLKLLEMGCLPGTEVCLNCTAPFGGPMCIKVAGYCLSLRRDEASTIILN